MAMPSTVRNDPIELAHRNWVAAGWADAADGMAFVTSIVRVQQLFANEVESRLRPLGLTFARFEVLRLLAFSQNGQLPAGKIGERLQVHPASVTNAVHRLESAGLVERTPNPADGRGVLASITPAGRELVAVSTALLNATVFERIPLPDRQLVDITAALGDLRREFGDFE